LALTIATFFVAVAENAVVARFEAPFASAAPDFDARDGDGGLGNEIERIRLVSYEQLKGTRTAATGRGRSIATNGA
jgi:hypothetical protein